jgi:hypothetical protein
MEGLALAQNPLRQKIVAGGVENAGRLDVSFIDHPGRQAIKSSFISFSSSGLARGLAMVMTNERLTYINHEGSPVWSHSESTDDLRRYMCRNLL